MTCWPTVAIHFGDLFYLPFLASSPSVNSDVKLTNLFKYHPLLSWQFCRKLLECDCSCSLVDIIQTADRRFVVEHATTSRKKARHLNSLIFKIVNTRQAGFSTSPINPCKCSWHIILRIFSMYSDAVSTQVTHWIHISDTDYYCRSLIFFISWSCAKKFLSLMLY